MKQEKKAIQMQWNKWEVVDERNENSIKFIKKVAFTKTNISVLHESCIYKHYNLKYIASSWIDYTHLCDGLILPVEFKDDTPVSIFMGETFDENNVIFYTYLLIKMEDIH